MAFTKKRVSKTLHSESIHILLFIFQQLSLLPFEMKSQIVYTKKLISFLLKEKVILEYQSHKKISSDNISQITISTLIYREKNGSLGIKLFLKQKFEKPLGIKFVPHT